VDDKPPDASSEDLADVFPPRKSWLERKADALAEKQMDASSEDLADVFPPTKSGLKRKADAVAEKPMAGKLPRPSESRLVRESCEHVAEGVRRRGRGGKGSRENQQDRR
jgi:hypothetical protein